MLNQSERYVFERQSIKEGMRLWDFPVNVIVETSSYCNLKCIMCPHPILSRQKGNMSMELFKKIVNEVAVVKDDTTLWLALLGEPLMNPNQLVNMVYYAKENRLKDVRLNTNGLLLTRDIAEYLIDARLDYALISVDAHNPETYAKIRRGGDLKKLTENVERLLSIRDTTRSKLKIVVQFIIMDENEGEADQFKDHWVSKGAIVKIRPKLSWGNTIEAKNLNLTQSDRTYPCPWLMRTISVHWTGKMAQCDFDYEGGHSPGDLNKQTIKEVWYGEIRNRQRKHMAGDFSHTLCKECKDWQVGRALFFGEGKR